VVSNRPDAAGLDRARAFGIPTAVIDHTVFGRDRAAFEHALDQKLRDQAIDLVCLAGFMRLLTPWFVDRWSGRMLNIHPSLLPQFKGLDTHRRALEAGAKRHGATVHFVVSEMDAGPIVVQGSVVVRADDTEQTLAVRVLELEHQLYPRALRAVAQGRTTV
jgi:phosphoribosylglycinamide formyltransferase 1